MQPLEFGWVVNKWNLKILKETKLPILCFLVLYLKKQVYLKNNKIVILITVQFNLYNISYFEVIMELQKKSCEVVTHGKYSLLK